MTIGGIESPKSPSRLSTSLATIGTAIRRIGNPDFVLRTDLAGTLSTWSSLKRLVEANLPSPQETTHWSQVGPFHEGDNRTVSALFYQFFDKNSGSLRLIYAVPGDNVRIEDEFLNTLDTLGSLNFPTDTQNYFMRPALNSLDALVQITIWDMRTARNILIETEVMGKVKRIPKIITLDAQDIPFPRQSYLELPRSEQVAKEAGTSVAINNLQRIRRILRFTESQTTKILE